MPEQESVIDRVYKFGKVLAMLAVVASTIFVVRDRLNAVPQLQVDLRKTNRRVDKINDKINYLVGAMQASTGIKYKPKIKPSSMRPPLPNENFDEEPDE